MRPRRTEQVVEYAFDVCRSTLNNEKEKAFEAMNSVWEPDEVWSSFISTMIAKKCQLIG